MSTDVRTPITQAMQEGALTRRELKALMVRSDGPALWRVLVFSLALVATSGLIALTYDSWWIWPAMFVHGVVIVHLFALQHECVPHYATLILNCFLMANFLPKNGMPSIVLRRRRNSSKPVLNHDFEQYPCFLRAGYFVPMSLDAV